MNSILKIILSLSISGSLMILILLLGKPLFKDRMSKGWQYYIWLVVIARLILPFAPEMNLVGSLFGQMEDRIKYENYLQNTTHAVSYGMDDSKAEGLSTLENDTKARVNWIDNQDEEFNTRYVLQNLWLIWLGAALLFFIRKITLYQSFSKYIKAGWQEVADVALLERVSGIETQMGIKRPVELCTNSLISTPLLLGFFRPCIVLPTVDLPEEDFGYIIRHELFHCKRGDMFYKWLVQIALCLHWFNPLVYRMEREIGRACELACDEAVMRMLDDSGRRAYGDTLLHAVGTGGGYKDSLATLSLNESAELLKERLGEIMKFKIISRRMRLCSLFLVSVFAAGAAVMGAYASPAGQLKFDGTDLMVSRKQILPMEDSGIGFVESTVKGDSSSSFRYTQESYYQAPYLFEIGWNVRENAGDFYAGAELSLYDGSRMKVFCTDKSNDIWEDSSAVDALTLLLTWLKSESAKAEFPLTRPLVVRVQNIGNVDPLVLAGQYYQDKEIAQYATVFAMLTEEEQDGLLQKSYQDDQLTFFSVLANRMSQEDLEEWTKRAAAEAEASRLKIEELPESVREAMQNCAVRTWYLICDDKEQYVFYNGFAWEYAYEPVRLEDGWRLRIERISKRDAGYLLVRLSGDAPVTVICDGEEVLLKQVEIP